MPVVDHSRYFDNAATTRVDPEVVQAMLPYFTEEYGNAHSIHQWGARAMHAVDQARQTIAGLLGADDPSQIVFTSGATEACNMALLLAPSEVWISPCEHSAVREPALQSGAKLIPVQDMRLGGFPAEASVFIMKVCNEVGGLVDPLQGKAKFRFSDLTQAVGKTPTTVAGLDAAAWSAHKFHGPKGIGGIFVREPVTGGLIRGGTQERGARAGTLNVPGIVGMATAMSLAVSRIDEEHHHAKEMRETVLDGIACLDRVIRTEAPTQLPHILSLTIEGLAAQTVVVELDVAGYAVSAGPACSAANPKPSATLMALGLNEQQSLSTVRVSFGRDNTKESAAGLAAKLVEIVTRLRNAQPLNPRAT